MKLGTLLCKRLEHLRNERLSRPALEAGQLHRFRRLVAHAQKHSPYYADLIIQHRIDLEQCVPQDFPVLTKRNVIDNFDSLVTDRRVTRQAVLDFLATSKDPTNLYLGRYYVVHTSGSSGEVGCFVFSARDWTCGIAHGLRMHGFAPRVQRIAFFGATRGHFAGMSMVSTGRRSINRLFYRIKTFEINSPLESVVQELNRFQPHVLIGYATALKILADRQEIGELRVKPYTLESSGEPLTREDRSRLQTVFGAPLLNVYSCTEHMIMGMGRPGDDGMLLFEDDLIFELRHDHTLITNLFNRTLPLIRYRMEDVLVPLDAEAGTTPFRKVREIVGRNEYVPFLRNIHGREDFISPHIINEFFVPGLRRFQMQLRDKASFLFKVCLEPGLDAAGRASALAGIDRRWREILAEKEMQNVAFELEEVSDLKVDAKTGKFRLVMTAPG